MIYKQLTCKCGYRGRDTSGKVTTCSRCGAELSVSEKWYVVYYDASGRQHAKAVSSRISDARLFLQQVGVKKALGESIEKEPVVTFDDAVKLFNNHLKTIRSSTQKTYGFSIKSLREHFGNIDLTLIGKTEIQEYQLESKCSPNKINHDIKVLKMLIKGALEHHSKSHDMPKLNRSFNAMKTAPMLADNTRDRVLTQDEVADLLRVCEGTTKMAVYIGLMTGLRLGNVMRLTWKQIDFDINTITIEAQDIKDDERLVIPLHPNLKAALQSWRKQVPINPLVLGGQKTIRTSFENACKKAGLQDVTFHCLRKTYATRLVESGVDIGTVADLLGHSDSNFTRKIYAHPSNDHRLESIRAYGEKIELGELKKG